MQSKAISLLRVLEAQGKRERSYFVTLDEAEEKKRELERKILTEGAEGFHMDAGARAEYFNHKGNDMTLFLTFCRSGRDLLRVLNQLAQSGSTEKLRTIVI